MDQLQTRLEALEQRIHTVERQLCWTRSLGGPMTRTAAGLLAVGLFLTGLLFAAPAGAQLPPPPVPMLPPIPFPLVGYCEGFIVEIMYTKFKQYFIQITTSPNGTTTLQIAGHAQATVTNLETGESVSYNVSGPGTIVTALDGSFSIDAGGPNLLWTLPENLPEPNVLNVPTISYTTGRVTLTVDASGQTTSYTLAGGARQTDVCAVLAP